MRKVLLSLVAMFLVATGMMADEYTVTQSTFTAVSGNLNGDANISFLAEKGNAGTAPAINNGVLRIYQNGGTLTVTANNDCKIKSITLGSSMNTSVTYSVDGGTASDEVMLAADKTIDVADIDASKVLFTCTGTTKTTRLYVNYLSVTYDDGKVAKVAKPTFSLAAGTYYGAQKVSVSCATEGAAIKYSTDGTNYTDYSAPITVSSSCTLYAKGVKDADESNVATAAYTIYPVYSSLAELVAAGAPTTTTGVPVQVTLTNERIQSIAMNAAGSSRIGVYVKSGDQIVELYLSGVPAEWVTDGKISGTVQASWMLYNGTWELKLNTGAWSDFTYTDPVYPFTVTDKAGNTVKNKFTGYNGNLQNVLKLIYNEDPSGLTFKINGEVAAYDATNGLTIKSTTNSQKNDVYTVTVYKGEELVTDQTFTYIPVVNVSSYKTLADGTEAVLNLANSKVTYVNSNGSELYFEDSSKGIQGYNLGLATTPAAFTTVKSGMIWGVKKTVNNIVEIARSEETVANSTFTQTTTAVNPTACTIAQAQTENNKLRYIKISGAKIIKKGTQYSVESADTTVNVYDKYSTKVLSAITATSYADLTCIAGVNSKGAVQLWPVAVENVCESLTGTCGGVTWTIDLDGNMVFAPTDGVSGTFAATGVAASKRPWANYVSDVKAVKFEEGVNATSDNSYMFKDMTSLESVDFTNFNTSAQTTMKGLFTGCTSLKSADMSVLDLSKVANFNLAFNGCSALESVDFGENTLPAATNFNSMFYSCHSLQTADFSRITGEAVTDMTSMFYDCTGLKKADLSALNTSKVASASKMKNFFGTGTYAAVPDTLILSRNFGKVASGDYITLPAKRYIAIDEEGFRIDGEDFNIAGDQTAQAALYAYNEGLADYGVYYTYTDPVYSFIAIDATGKTVNSKYTGKNLTLKYKGDATGLTFTVNGTETAYDAEKGIVITSKIGSKANDKYVVKVSDGTKVIAKQTFTYIPVATSVSTLLGYADGTEAVLQMSNAKVTYAAADGSSAYIEDASRSIYADALGLGFTAYKQAKVNIWATKTTVDNIAEIVACDSTALSTVTPGTAAVTPTALTVAQTLSANNQLRYAKIAGAQILKEGTQYYAVCADDKVAITDKLGTGACKVSSCYADLTCIVAKDAEGAVVLYPLAVDNVSGLLSGTCGSVSWSIDMDGNMLFFPTDGVSGTFAATGIAASKRPWASYTPLVKTISFEGEVNATSDNSYLFKDMTNAESIDLANFNTSAQTTMKGMFMNCSSVTSIDMSGLDLSQVTNFQQAFNGCTALESVNFGENTFTAATNFNSMFYSCQSLKAAEMGNANPAAVTDVTTMFYNCTSLAKVDLRSLKTSKVASAAKMKNFFGTGAYAAKPDTLYLSKNFGKVASGDYIALPQLYYVVYDDIDDDPVEEIHFDLHDSAQQTAFYKYNEGLAEYGAYIFPASHPDPSDIELSSQFNTLGGTLTFDRNMEFAGGSQTATVKSVKSGRTYTADLSLDPDNYHNVNVTFGSELKVGNSYTIEIHAGSIQSIDGTAVNDTVIAFTITEKGKSAAQVATWTTHASVWTADGYLCNPDNNDVVVSYYEDTKTLKIENFAGDYSDELSVVVNIDGGTNANGDYDVTSINGETDYEGGYTGYDWSADEWMEPYWFNFYVPNAYANPTYESGEFGGSGYAYNSDGSSYWTNYYISWSNPAPSAEELALKEAIAEANEVIDYADEAGLVAPASLTSSVAAGQEDLDNGAEAEYADDTEAIKAAMNTDKVQLMKEVAEAYEYFKNAPEGVNAFQYLPVTCARIHDAFTAANKAISTKSGFDLILAKDEFEAAIKENSYTEPKVNELFTISDKDGNYLNISDGEAVVSEEPTYFQFHKVLVDGAPAYYLYNTDERVYLGYNGESVVEQWNRKSTFYVAGASYNTWYIAPTAKPEDFLKADRYNGIVAGTENEAYSKWFISYADDAIKDTEAEEDDAEATAITSAEAANVDGTFYTTGGARLAGAQKGINIVKYSNGIVKKVLVK